MFPYLLQLFKEEIPFLVHKQYRKSTDYMLTGIRLLTESVDLGDKWMGTSIPHSLYAEEHRGKHEPLTNVED